MIGFPGGFSKVRSRSFFLRLVSVEYCLELLLLHLCMLSSLLLDDFSMGEGEVADVGVDSLVSFCLVTVLALGVEIAIETFESRLILLHFVPLRHIVC